MRGVHSAVDEIRRNVFTEVARLAYEGGDLKRVDMIPYTIVPGEVARHRHDVFLERAIVQERVRLALGMSRLQLLWHCVLPQCRSAVMAALLLGFARALGDTLLPLMLSGNTPQLPQGPASGVRALTAHMAMTAANETGGAAYDSLFAAGFLLLCANAVIGLMARRLAAGSHPGEARS